MTPKRPWSPADIATLRRMAQAGYTDGEIARALRRDRRATCDKRHALGIRPGISAAMVAMMARITHRRRTRKILQLWS